MPFLRDFCHLGSGTETPDRFLIWAGISLIGAIAGRKLYSGHGTQVETDCRMYINLVGTPASGKSTGMSFAERIFIEHFPKYLISESIQSREDILKKMTSPECEKSWKDPKTGHIQAWRPFYCLVDEMENFVSVDDTKMVGMLVGIYGRSYFSTGFKGDTNPDQRIKNPYLCLLGCTVPEWLMSSLRMSLFTGGLGRRLVIVHCKKTKKVPFPNKPADYADTMQRVVSHLKQVEQAGGFLVWTPEANKWWERWYLDDTRKSVINPILAQFDENEHMQLIKVAIALALSEDSLRLEIDVPHLAAGYELLKDLKPDIERLTSGIGRNELAGIGAQLIDHLDRMGGFQTEVNVKKFFRRYANTPEFNEILHHYKTTGELVEIPFSMADGMARTYFATPEGYEKMKKLNQEVIAAGGKPALSLLKPAGSGEPSGK